MKSDDGTISDLTISEEGSRFLVAECRNQQSSESIATVWSCEKVIKCKEIHTIKYVFTSCFLKAFKHFAYTVREWLRNTWDLNTSFSNIYIHISVTIRLEFFPVPFPMVKEW